MYSANMCAFFAFWNYFCTSVTAFPSDRNKDFQRIFTICIRATSTKWTWLIMYILHVLERCAWYLLDVVSSEERFFTNQPIFFFKPSILQCFFGKFHYCNCYFSKTGQRQSRQQERVKDNVDKCYLLEIQMRQAYYAHQGKKERTNQGKTDNYPYWQLAQTKVSSLLAFVKRLIILYMVLLQLPRE